MTEETKVAINKWRELIAQIADTYITVKKAEYTEDDARTTLSLSHISQDCAQMLLIVEGISK